LTGVIVKQVDLLMSSFYLFISGFFLFCRYNAERLIEDDNGTRFYLDQAGGEVFLNQKDIANCKMQKPL
jgi:hypothetical protein